MKNICLQNFYRYLKKYGQFRTCYSNTNNYSKNYLENIRNIGILAHIDAGKTTTTERMLYYSGVIPTMGEVHHGNTVTDYMEQERQRGITITSAAVSFPWNDSQINLIDTPGHIDFTMEVEQSLAVLDGAVVVLDGSAGVEAQTLTVWRQADGYRLPRILYLNKMDRSDASEDMCVATVKQKLQATPLLLQMPVRFDSRLIGLIDIITKEELIWTKGRGRNYTKRGLTEPEDGYKWETCMTRRRHLVDTISNIDNKFAETVIEKNSMDDLTPAEIQAAIRRCTTSMKAFPVVCGSSYKNIGVQTLMDAILAYLPTPWERNRLYKSFGLELSARAFKVVHDRQRGVLTFLRLYTGEISKGQKIFNLGQNKSEQTGGLYVPLADEYLPMENVVAGNIAVVSSLKSTASGDLITTTQAAANRAKNHLASMIKESGDTDEDLILPAVKHRIDAMEGNPSAEEKAEVLLGIGNTVPDPVFVCSIEPPSAAYQLALETALAELQREDPSLRVNMDDETGQIVLAGMGELHLQIIKERIIREYKIDVELGPLQIAYRETLLKEAQHAVEVDRKISGSRQLVKLVMSAKPVQGLAQDKVLRLDKSPGSAANLAHLHPRHLAALKQGVATALLHGPRLGCPLIDVQVTLHWFESSKGTSDSVVSSTVVQCLRKVFESAEAILLEPVMALQVVCPDTHSASVLADLSRRRADIRNIYIRNHNKVFDCIAPLSELVGYSTTLRSITSGLATFTMEFHSNRQMSSQDEKKAIRSVTGF